MHKIKEAHYWIITLENRTGKPIDRSFYEIAEHYSDVKVVVGDQVKEFSFDDFCKRLDIKWPWQ